MKKDQERCSFLRVWMNDVFLEDSIYQRKLIFVVFSTVFVRKEQQGMSCQKEYVSYNCTDIIKCVKSAFFCYCIESLAVYQTSIYPSDFLAIDNL